MHQIAILLNFLLDCRESAIIEYCGTFYGTKLGGLKALCLYSIPQEISDFEDDLDEERNTNHDEVVEADTDVEDITQPTSIGVTLDST